MLNPFGGFDPQVRVDQQAPHAAAELRVDPRPLVREQEPLLGGPHRVVGRREDDLVKASMAEDLHAVALIGRSGRGNGCFARQEAHGEDQQKRQRPGAKRPAAIDLGDGTRDPLPRRRVHLGAELDQ